jgi:hypothetical protein
VFPSFPCLRGNKYTNRTNRTTPTTPTLPVELLDFYVKVLTWSSKDGNMNRNSAKKTNSTEKTLLNKKRNIMMEWFSTSKKENIEPENREHEHRRGNCFNIPKNLDGESTAMMINISLNTNGLWAWEVIYVIHSKTLMVRKIGKKMLMIPKLKMVGVAQLV